MNAYHILFLSGRFNLSKVQPHFINDCCFGEDLAAWLKEKLAGRGVESSGPGQEDWGWYLNARLGDSSYFLAISGNSDDGARDQGEWRIIVKKRRSLWDVLAGRGRITADDPMLTLVREVLTGQSDVSSLRCETDVHASRPH
jgi:hypothetical protein